jgi:hypothetical protein
VRDRVRSMRLACIAPRRPAAQGQCTHILSLVVGIEAQAAALLAQEMGLPNS